MPWYKAFDETRVPPAWDGVLRLNVYGGTMWFPEWVLDGGAFSVDIAVSAMRMGPYFGK